MDISPYSLGGDSARWCLGQEGPQDEPQDQWSYGYGERMPYSAAGWTHPPTLTGWRGLGLEHILRNSLQDRPQPMELPERKARGVGDSPEADIETPWSPEDELARLAGSTLASQATGEDPTITKNVTIPFIRDRMGPTQLDALMEKYYLEIDLQARLREGSHIIIELMARATAIYPDSTNFLLLCLRSLQNTDLLTGKGSDCPRYANFVIVESLGNPQPDIREFVDSFVDTSCLLARLRSGGFSYGRIMADKIEQARTLRRPVSPSGTRTNRVKNLLPLPMAHQAP